MKDYLITFRDKNPLYVSAYGITDLLNKVAVYTEEDTEVMCTVINMFANNPTYKRIELYNLYAKSHIFQILEIAKCVYEEELMGK